MNRMVRNYCSSTALHCTALNQEEQEEQFVQGQEVSSPNRLHGHKEVHIHIQGLALADQIHFTGLSVLLRVRCREWRVDERGIRR